MPEKTKQASLKFIQEHIANQKEIPEKVANKTATALYLQDIQPHIASLPEPLKDRIANLLASEQY